MRSSGMSPEWNAQKKSPMEMLENYEDLRTYQKIQRNLQRRENAMFKNKTKLRQDHRLTDNIFAFSSIPTNMTLKPNLQPKKCKFNSKLEQVIKIGLDSKTNSPVKKKTGYLDSLDMNQNLFDNFNDTKKNQGISLYTKKIKKKSIDLSVSQIVKDRIVENQLREVSQNQLAQEKNDWMKNPSEQELMNSIINQNSELNSLKMELFKLKYDSRNIYQIEKKVRSNKDQLRIAKEFLRDTQEDLNNKERIAKPMDTLRKKIEKLEEEMSVEELRKRDTLIKKIHRIDKRCGKYQKDLDEIDQVLEKHSENLETNKAEINRKELEILNETLEDDPDERMLIMKLQKMIQLYTE